MIVTALGITTVKVWNLLNRHSWLRANERSMMVKVAFSMLTWLSNVIFLVILTTQVIPTVPK